MKFSVYRTIGRLYPKFIRVKLETLLVYSNIKIDSGKFLGFSLSFSLLLSLAIGFNLGVIFAASFLPLFLISFFALNFSVYMWLLLTADKKGKFIEEVLPDALQLMSSNLRAGFTTDKALLLAARPEFGPLRDEINIVGKEIATGKEIGESMMGIIKRVKSSNLERTIELIVSGIKSGGELSSLLDETAADLRNQHLVDKKIRSSVNMYIIFIFVAAGFASPVLFGLSSYLVEVLTFSMSQISIPNEMTNLNLPFSFTSIAISVDFVIKFAITFLITTSFFGSFIIGLISRGKEKDGVKFIPIIMLLSLALFFLSRIIIKAMLGGLFL
ncbi:MAG: type II secretion system F family protein [Candidatus Woesearchaeota archaeon]